MIESQEIINFQSHVHSVINYTGGLNIITGSSDSGKSAILRSLLWVVNNRPSGDSIRNWLAKEKDSIKVSVNLSNKAVVSKERKQGKQSYQLIKNNEPRAFDAFKSDVPAEIQDEFNLSEFNIQTQHQPYFLLNDSPGEIARKLNDLVGLGIIDTLFKNLNSKVLSTDREIKSLNSELIELNDGIDSLSFLDVAGRELIKLEIKIEKQNKLMKDVVELADRIDDFCSLSLKLEENEKILRNQEAVEKIQLLVNNFNDVSSRALAIDKEIKSFFSMKKQIESYDTTIKQEEAYRELKIIIDEFIKLVDLENKLGNEFDKYKQCSRFIKIEKDKLEKDEKEYRDLLKQNGVCPMCGSKI